MSFKLLAGGLKICDRIGGSLEKILDSSIPNADASLAAAADSSTQFSTADVGWISMSADDHFVQLYDTDPFLLDSLSGFVGMGLAAGDACVVVATKSHREELEARLQQRGIDLNSFVTSGQYIALDAAETLSKLLVDGRPDAARFDQIVGGLLTRAVATRTRLRVFGEMVALLWMDEKYEEAIALEKLWNDLHAEVPFSLFCAYPMNGFGSESLGAQLNQVCAHHSRVIPAEDFTTLTHPEERLRAITSLQQKARSLEKEIAERKRAEKALRDVRDELEMLLVREQIARAEAEGANRLKDEFLATVSHELRTPLTAIIGWSHMLRNGALDEATRTRALETIERNATSQAQLVEDILDVSRVITGKLRLNIEPVDAAAVINAAIDSVQLAADSKGIRLEVTLDPFARHVSGDAGRLQQVVWNLLSNAIKFTPSGGRVEVRLERVDANVQIQVRDTGCGFSSDFLPFIFDRFRQADGTSTRTHGGLGLGLAIVRHLVELHGGTVQAESDGAGFGATFTILLPLAGVVERPTTLMHTNESSWLDGSASRHELVNSLEGVRLLMVDDDGDTLHMLITLLEAKRAIVQTAASVPEALEIIKWYRPHVVVSDLAMPEEDGFSFIRKLRGLEDVGRTPAIALTAYVRVADRARALSAGYNMFVAKPVEPTELITAIVNLAEPVV